MERDRNKKLVFENFNELDEFLECDLLPNNIIYKRKIGDKSGKLYLFLQLDVITDLKLSKSENEHIMEYLAKEKIQVREIDSFIDGEYENYDYFKTYQTLNKDEIKSLSQSEQIKLFEELRKTSDPSIREKLIVSNIKLANYIAYKFDFVELGDDVLQLAYEGLIKAVDKFDPSLGVNFASYAYRGIKNNIKKHYIEIRNSFGGDQNPMWQLSFKKCREIVEKNNDCSITEDESLIEDVVDLMIKEGTVPLSARKLNIDRIKIYFCNVSLEENFDEIANIENTDPGRQLENMVNNNLLIETIDEVLDTLTPREKQILEMRFGLNGNEVKTQNEVGKIMNITGERVRQIETRAMKKMQNPSRLEKFYAFYDDPKDDQVNFSVLLNQLQESTGFIEKQYLKEYKDMKVYDEIYYYLNNMSNPAKRHAEDVKASNAVLLEYKYYCENNITVFNYFEELCKLNDLTSKEQLEEIFSILDIEEQEVVVLKYGLNKEKPLDIDSICLKTGKKFEEIKKLLASFTKKICYYHHHYIKENELFNDNKKEARK